MATNVGVDSIVDSIVAKLAVLVPVGNALTAALYLYSVQRFVGGEFATQEAFERGIAGRCPAVRVRYDSTRMVRKTIGARVEREESTFSVIACSDRQRGRDERRDLITVLERIRRLVGSRTFGLAMSPMRYRRTSIVQDDDRLLAIGDSFTTLHRTDYTIDPGGDTMETAGGDFNTPADADGNADVIGESDIIFDDSEA